MRRLILIIIFSISVFVTSAQNNTNSPYSIFGIGELEHTDGGRNMGMGGTGAALRSNIFLLVDDFAVIATLTRDFYSLI